MDPSVGRAALKILALQRLCCLDVVLVRHIMAALQEEGGAKPTQDVMLNREDVNRVLNKVFDNASQEVRGHVTVTGPEETCSLMFRLFERSRTGCVSSRSLQTALITLSGDDLLLKLRGLVSVLDNSSGFISRSQLRSVLQDLSQVPAAVQEEDVFGSVETAVSFCFQEVMTVSKEHVLSWLQGEPSLLLWLPALNRLSVSKRISHAVRCHTCKTFPIVGLRYRCKKCVNVHVCQNCYLTNQQSWKHKTHHPVVEFCTQPTWKESLASLMRNARHTLLPWRYIQRDADRRVLKWVEPGDIQNRAPPPSDVSTLLADSAQNPNVSHDASVHASPPPCVCKSLQTDEEQQSQQVSAALLTEVRNLQRDKWLLEQQLQAWHLTVQSEQGILEDRCSEMEVTMETLRQHNDQLQSMLTKALNKIEAQQHVNSMPLNCNMEHSETENLTPTSNSLTNTEEEELKIDLSESELQTPFPTIQLESALSHEELWEEDFSEMYHDHSLGQLTEFEGEGRQKEEEDHGTCIPEQQLQETVDRLKTEIESRNCTDTHTGVRWEAELLDAAEKVGNTILLLVETVRTK